MFRGYGGDLCCEVDEAGQGVVWRIVRRPGDETVQTGKADDMKSGIQAAYAALLALRVVAKESGFLKHD